MIYTILMKKPTPEKLIVSLFQIPEDYRAQLASIAANTEHNNHQASINSCIVQAWEDYFNLPEDEQPKPSLPKVPLRAFTVRTSSVMKQEITHCAATWQLKSSLPVSMNAVVNSAILAFLQKKIPSYQPPF